MSNGSMRIGLISPHAWPPRDDVAHHLEAEGRALARRGHRVTIFAPATRKALIVAGRSILLAAQAGDAEALSPAPGEVLEVAIGRALPAGPGRRVGEPFDLSATLETLLSRAPFDVVHLHEPLAPSPALAALRHAPGVTAATFHRAEPLAGVAFLRPLVDRALARANLRIATTEAGCDALSEILPGRYTVIPAGVDAELFRPTAPRIGPPGVVLVARGRDRAGVRFALGVLRTIDLTTVGTVTLLGPADAPWRTRAAVPKALRDAVRVVPDEGPASRAAALAAADIAILAAPEDAAGPVLREALAAGCAVLVPRCAAALEGVVDGVDALVLPPFTREVWAHAVGELIGDPLRRVELQGGALARGRGRTWDDVASDLERAYRDALEVVQQRPDGALAPRVRADLRVRPGPELSPRQIVAVCTELGVDVVAVASPDGLAAAQTVASAAPPGLAVIVGQEIATSDGLLVGLFLTHPVAPGMDLKGAATAIRAQGGLVMVPHPDATAPSPTGLRSIVGMIDCHEVIGGDDTAADSAVAMLRRLGMRVCAGSSATRPEEIGTAVTEMNRFEGTAEFLSALSDANLHYSGRRGANDGPRAKGRRRRSPKS